jgi:hypothetical protein
MTNLANYEKAFVTIFLSTPAWKRKSDKKNSADNSEWKAKWANAVVEIVYTDLLS